MLEVLLDDYSRGAGVATELVNTAPGVWSGTDQLADAAALGVFLTDYDVVTSSDAPPTGDDLVAVHGLRDRLRTLIDHPDRDALVRGATALTTGIGALTLVTTADGRSHWAARVPDDAPVADVLALVSGAGVLGVVHALGPERFRPCSAPTCSGVYIDTSRPGRRRYCMPEICGNRVNVANHRARQRDT